MQSNFDISIIIPMYNSSRYIEDAINSVLNQEAHNFNYEIVVVDDGSSDNSVAIVEHIKSDKIKLVVRAYNGGLSAARNSGLHAATGTWIQFLDSDDRISSDLFNKFEQTQNLEFNCYIFSFIREQYGYSLKQKIREINDIRAFTHFGGTACNKFIKKEICVEFKEGFFSEDVSFCIDMMNKRELKIALIDDAYYFYNKKNETSLTSNFNREQYQQMFSYAYSQIDKSNEFTKMFILETFIAIIFNKSVPFLMRIQIATKTLLKLYRYFPAVIFDLNRKYVENTIIR